MKKAIIAIAMAIVMIACMFPASAANDYTYDAIYGTPVVDGDVDDIWNYAPIIQCGGEDAIGDGTGPNIAWYGKVDWTEHSMQVRAMWDEENFYVLYDVVDSDGGQYSSEDPNQWQMDSVDFYMDETYVHTPNSMQDSVQLRMMTWIGLEDPDAFTADLGYGVGTIFYQTKRTAEGYIIEGSYPWQHITPTIGHVLGTDFQGNNNIGDDSSVASWVRWNSEVQDAPYQNNGAFGTVTLVAAPVIEGEEEEEEEEPELTEIEDVEEEEEETVEEVEEEEEEETTTTTTTTTTTNPTTADVSLIFYALASVSAIGGIALFRKK